MAVFSRSADKSKAEKILGREIAESGRFGVYRVNICDKESIHSALDEVEKNWGPPDVLVNNAGIDTRATAFTFR